MDGKTKGSLPNKNRKPKDLTTELAELLYYAGGNGPMVSFDEVPENKQNEYLKHATLAIVCLDKMNKMVVPKVSADEQFKIRIGRIDKVEEVVRTFINTLNKPVKPSSIANYFPVHELAARIVDARID